MDQNDQSVKVEVSGTPVEIPGNLQVGQTIKDSETTMTMTMGKMKIDTVVKQTDGKCEAIEDITVQAGTFKCHKISQTVSYTTPMRKTQVMKVVTWYAPGVGTVKTETYNDKNKLQGTTELAEVKGN